MDNKELTTGTNSNASQTSATRGNGNGNGTATTRAGNGADARFIVPRVDVLEDEAGITLLADLPGVPRDRLELKVEGDTLQVEGVVATPMPHELKSVYAELRVPRYRRSFTLSRELDPAGIEANLRDGVLTLRIPKQEHARPRRIEVRAG